MSRPATPAIDRILSRCEETGDGCWTYRGYTNYGYGQIRVEEEGVWVTRPAHRITFAFFMGPIPDGLTIDHLCRNRSCVNPWHHDPVPRSVNSRRAVMKDVCRKGLHPVKQGARCAPCRSQWRKEYRARRGWE